MKSKRDYRLIYGASVFYTVASYIVFVSFMYAFNLLNVLYSYGVTETIYMFVFITLSALCYVFDVSYNRTKRGILSLFLFPFLLCVYVLLSIFTGGAKWYLALIVVLILLVIVLFNYFVTQKHILPKIKQRYVTLVTLIYYIVLLTITVIVNFNILY